MAAKAHASKGIVLNSPTGAAGDRHLQLVPATAF